MKARKKNKQLMIFFHISETFSNLKRTESILKSDGEE